MGDIESDTFRDVERPGVGAWKAYTDDPDTASAPAEGRWQFDANVTAAFEDMLERSIPDYTNMRRIVTDAASWVMDAQSLGGRGTPKVVDLGCSRGASLAPLVDRWGARARFLGVEMSPPMLAAAKERFGGMVKAGVVRIEPWDLREGYPLLFASGLEPGFASATSVTLCVLTLQFVPVEYRHRLLAEARRQAMSGGALILVEKVLGESLDSNGILVDLYHGLKRENGYTQEAIDRKRFSLEGSLVPLTASWNEDLLRKAGWETVEVLWAWANFRAWLAVAR